jgi:hypothetical protein
MLKAASFFLLQELHNYFSYVNLKAVNRMSSLVFEPGFWKYRSPLKAVSNNATIRCSRLDAKKKEETKNTCKRKERNMVGIVRLRTVQMR